MSCPYSLDDLLVLARAHRAMRDAVVVMTARLERDDPPRLCAVAAMAMLRNELECNATSSAAELIDRELRAEAAIRRRRGEARRAA